MRFTVACLIVFVSFSVIAAGTGCRRTAEPQPPKKEERTTVGVSLSDLKDPRQAGLKADIEAAAAGHPNLRLEVRDAGGDPARQRGDLERFLADRVGLAVVVPLDAHATTETVAKLFDAGVPVVVLGRAVIGEKYTCLIAPDWKQIGTAAGDWLAGKLDGKGKIVEIKGPADSHQAGLMHDAFRARLRDPGYRFVFEGFLDPPRVDGGKLMAEAIADVDRIDAVFAFDDGAALSARRAAEAAGRADGVLFIGVGGTPDGGAKLVKDGLLSASVLIPSGGVEAIDAALKILAGGAVPKTIVPQPRVLAE